MGRYKRRREGGLGSNRRSREKSREGDEARGRTGNDMRGEGWNEGKRQNK